MSSGPSAPPASSSAGASSSNPPPKKTTILTPGNNGPGSAKPNLFSDKKKIVKSIEIVLTLFYGQFIANAIFDNFVRGLPDLIETGSEFPAVKVALGVIILAASVYSLIAIWMKKWILIFVSAILLIVISVTSLILTVIDLVQRKERGQTVGKDFGANIAEVAIEALFRVGAIIAKFFMIRLLKLDYHRVPTSA